MEASTTHWEAETHLHLLLPSPPQMLGGTSAVRLPRDHNSEMGWKRSGTLILQVLDGDKQSNNRKATTKSYYGYLDPDW